MEIGETSVRDDPENGCFACSPHNTHGLQMRFIQTEEHTVEARYTVPRHMEGGSRVVHGGIQAVLLDEVMGAAVQRGFQEEGDFVTAEMSLRYRRPANVEQELLLRAELKRSEGRDYFVEGEILDSSGEVLTRASARWVKLGTTPEPRHG